jgi:predicted house-cleaning noncanonical NTP pyrophosphatase (MazG superfamily)
MNIKVNLTRKLVETLTREIIAENKAKRVLKEAETLDPQVQDLVDKLKGELDETKKMEMNEGFADYSELVMQILAGAYGAAAVGYFASLAALAFKKGGKEELQKAMKELEKAHRGGSLGGH